MACRSLCRFHMLMIGGSDERLLRRWINLIFVGWLPQLMIRRGAALILQSERRVNPSRNRCGSRGNTRIPQARRSSDFPILSGSVTGLEAHVRHSTLAVSGQVHGSRQRAMGGRLLNASFRIGSGRIFACLSRIRSMSRPGRGFVSACRRLAGAFGSASAAAWLAAGSCPAAMRSDSAAGRSPK